MPVARTTPIVTENPGKGGNLPRVGDRIHLVQLLARWQSPPGGRWYAKSPFAGGARKVRGKGTLHRRCALRPLPQRDHRPRAGGSRGERKGGVKGGAVAVRAAGGEAADGEREGSSRPVRAPFHNQRLPTPASGARGRAISSEESTSKARRRAGSSWGSPGCTLVPSGTVKG